MPIRASRVSRGMTTKPATCWSPGWSPTRSQCSLGSTAWNSALRPLTRSGCWRSLPARMSSLARAMAVGVSHGVPPRTGWTQQSNAMPNPSTARECRRLVVNPHDTELVEARRAWRDGDFAHDYRRWRPMVERSLAWLVRPGRRVAYRGIARNRIWLAHRAAAINLQRLITLGL